MDQEKENIPENFIDTQAPIEKNEQKVSVVWLNSPHDFLRKSLPKKEAPKRSFLNSMIEASPAFKVKERKKFKENAKIQETILEKKEKFKEFWENLGSKISITPKNRSKSLSPQESVDIIQQNVRRNSEDQIAKVTLVKKTTSCFSDFEEDELLLSMDVDAVIQLQDRKEESKKINFHRILVDSVRELMHSSENIMIKEIKGQLSTNNRQVTIELRDDWYDLSFNSGLGDFVHITGDLNLNNSYHIIGNESKNFVITHPDLLLSVTTIADSFECVRKSYLSTRTGLANTASPAMVHGKMLHELFQMSLQSGDFSSSGIKQNLDHVIKNSTASLYSIGEHEEKASSILVENIDKLSSWGSAYYGPKATSSSVLVRNAGDKYPSFGSVKAVLDIEERIWSPKYGIKGYIDATTIMNHDNDGSNSDLLVPLEFKTGKNMSIAHEAQTGLYTLMISDKYGVECSAGILYYLSGSNMKLVTQKIHHIRALIIGRNALAHYIKSGDQLPPMLSHRKFICQRCFALDTCLFYHKAFEDGTVNSVNQSGLKLEFEEKTKDLTDNHIQFFKKWDALISLEECDDVSIRREIWAFESEKREKLGRCFSNMKILECHSSSSAKSICQFTYTFIRSDCSQGFKSLLDSSLKERDPIVVSSESGQVALAIGYIIAVSSLSVTVEVDKPLTEFKGFSPLKSHENVPPSSQLYRIDKDQLSGGSSMGRNSLINLFIDPKSAKLRDLIVDMKAPYFSSARVDFHDARLNEDQISAIGKVLSGMFTVLTQARDYVIILGMPGTGKTFTISQIVKELISRNKSVLLTSYTHSAVDNILLKLVDEKIDFCRLGNHQRIHPRIIPFTAEHKHIGSVSEMEVFYESKWVVATTCLALNHVIFSKRRFDYCIVDEASQLTLPHCIGPLQYANTFVLVGDHYQLSPLVRNEQAVKGGMAESLFKTLSEKHPQSVVNLRYQYRMNSDIMNLSNTLIYDKRLICADQEVSESSFSYCTSNPVKFIQGPLSENKIERIIDPKSKVLFINTDTIPDSKESSSAETIQNRSESKIVCQILSSLLSNGASMKQVGILSFYNSQLQLIRSEIPEFDTDLELLTIDKSQGRDKECIIVSFVRSNSEGHVGNLLIDWRRINVLLTRAKSKLILVGSVSTLSKVPILDELFSILREQSVIL